ncbi:hypothetical protein SUGI_0511490 [Cryptomeria japonica]|nr:hypothetical protein SUGI_0511490 [Cryptomeria japonica]
MYSQTFSYTPFRHCSVVPLPPNYYYAIKPPAHIKSRVAFERRPGSWSSLITKSGLKHLFDVGEREGDEEGPIELPQDFNPFEVPEATPLQITASCLLTGSIAFLLYRSFKRRAKRAKEKRFRSSGVEDVRKEAKLEALKALEKANSLAEELKPNGPPPSAVQALVGAIMAGAIAYVLYNFTIAVESSLDKQFVSSNYSIRQIKITTRTIINDSKPVETENKVNVEAKDDSL